MVSSTMIIQDEMSGHQSSTFHPSENSVVMDASAQSIGGEGHVLKIRKPYTITKQRERWTEEEHNKFIEALKLYGRAWRKIEEHVGTKTAVQIRSHAQKFFFKVVRETNNSNTTTTETIEIPPPRPKRKPLHPYPRKLVFPLKKECPSEQRARSSSPNSSLSDQENQSPTSVLSVVVSDTLGSANGSSSPISSADVINQVAHVPSDDNAPQDDMQLPKSVPNHSVSVKLELFPDIDAVNKDESPCNTKVFKLFGKNVVVANQPSDDDDDSPACMSKMPSSDMGEGEFQTSPENPNPIDNTRESSVDSHDQFHNQFHNTMVPTFYYVDGNMSQVEKPIALPLWAFYTGMPVAPLGGCVDGGDVENNETPREGSCAGSNSWSVDGEGNGDKWWDAETLSGQSAPHSEEPNSGQKPASLEKRSIVDRGTKGFVPYKRRCLAERDVQSSMIPSNNEKGDQRIRLCL